MRKGKESVQRKEKMELACVKVGGPWVDVK